MRNFIVGKEVYDLGPDKTISFRTGGKEYFKINRQLKERYRFVIIVLNRKRWQFCHNLVSTELGIEFLIPLE